MAAEQLLRDPNIQPTDEALSAALSGGFTARRLLGDKLTGCDIWVEWRYYNDGKAWLAKCVSGWV